jgi:hypothetical protein
MESVLVTARTPIGELVWWHEDASATDLGGAGLADALIIIFPSKRQLGGPVLVC